MLTALSLEQMNDVEAIEAAIKLSMRPFDADIPDLLIARGIDRELVSIYSRAVSEMLKVFFGGNPSHSVKSVRAMVNQGPWRRSKECAFDSRFSAEYVSDRFRAMARTTTAPLVDIWDVPVVKFVGLLVDALVLVVLGIGRIRRKGKNIDIEPAPGFYEHIARRVVAQGLDMQSRLSQVKTLISAVRKINRTSQKSGFLSQDEVVGLGEEFIDHWSEILVDRILSLNPRRRDRLNSACSDLAERMLAIAKWVAVAQICACTGKPVRLSNTWLQARGMDFSLIDFVEKVCPPYSYESFFWKSRDSMEFSLQCWADQLITHLCSQLKNPETGTSEKFPDGIGQWFEKEYVSSDLTEYAHENGWKVCGDFTIAAGNGHRGGDVDVVLCRGDVETLFLQVKYLQRYWMPYWCDELMLVRPMRKKGELKPPGFVKGLLQLRSVHMRRSEKEVIQAVALKMGWPYEEAATRLHHGTYILVHNIPTYDHAACEGVVMYEWNSFRNLIRGGSHRLNVETFEEVRVPFKTPLSKPFELGLELLNADFNPEIRSLATKAKNVGSAKIRVDLDMEGDVNTLWLPIV